jgi:biopolymer transport protein TolR
MSFKLREPSSPLSEINVTPFVDVMLVLLVIFMVTAPMLSQGLPVNLPSAPARPLVNQQPLVVSINRDQVIYLDDQRVPLADLRDGLARRAGENKNLEVLLKSDRDVPYGLVVQVMSALNEAGVEKLGIVTAPPTPREGKR